MKRIIAGLASVLVAGAAVVTTSAPAQATTYDVVVKKNGERKAQATVNNENRRVCLRVYNAPKGFASVRVEYAGQALIIFDTGGDADRSCAPLRRDMFPSGAIAEVVVTFEGSGGWTKSEVGYAYFP